MRYIIHILLAAACLLAGGCKPKYANRVEKILSEINDPASDYVLVACHRGDWRNYPENSIPAMESVIRMGADILELDVKMTRDSQLVIMHDPKINRTVEVHTPKVVSYGTTKVSELTLAQLKSLHLCNGQGIETDSTRIPTLEEALRCCKDRILVNVDGGIDHYDMVMDIARKVGVVDQIIIKGGSVERARRKLGRYDDKPLYMPIVSGYDLDEAKAFMQASENDPNLPIVAFELYFGKRGQVEDYDKVSSAIREFGARVWINTIGSAWCGLGNDDNAAFDAADPADVYGPVIEHGINIIQTDRPDLLLRYLRSVGRHD